MLSTSDLHLLAGLLMAASKPDLVQVDIADAHRDAGGQNSCEVLIKILAADSGQPLAALAAIQATNKQPSIDAVHVDRLWPKFEEIPAGAERGIVAAGNFTDPAIEKARQLGLCLYVLEPASMKQLELAGIKVPADLQLDFDEPGWEWVSRGDVLFRPAENIPAQEMAGFSPSLAIVDSAPGSGSRGLTIQQYLESVMSRPARDILGARADSMKDGEVPVVLRINLQDRPVVLIKNRRVAFDQVRINAVLRRQTTRRNTAFSVLRNQQTDQLYGPAAIAQYSNNNLLGLARESGDRTRMILIPPGDARRAQIQKSTMKR